MNYKILLVVPVFNEKNNIAGVVDEIHRDLSEFDVLIVNDCSQDGTMDVLKMKNVPFLSLPINLGYAGALQTGFKYATTKDYDYVVQFDGDGQHVAIEVRKLVERIVTTRSDIVIGSRFIANNNYKHPFLKRLGTNFFVQVIKFACGKTITDPTSGFQILSRNIFAHYNSMPNFPKFPDANLLVEMLLKGYLVEEVGVNMRERYSGVGMHVGLGNNIRYMTRTSYNIILVLLRFLGLKINKFFDKTEKH
jgi:glycosyltransferase involved in cell wall biosynthesis